MSTGTVFLRNLINLTAKVKNFTDNLTDVKFFGILYRLKKSQTEEVKYETQN